MKIKVHENSKLPKILTYINPTTWIAVALGREVFSIRAIALGKHIFVDGDANPRLIRHESIHCYQWVETYYIGFLLLYLKDWVHGLFKFRNEYQAYKNIRAEQEAYGNEKIENYLETRIPKQWITKYKV